MASGGSGGGAVLASRGLHPQPRVLSSSSSSFHHHATVSQRMNNAHVVNSLIAPPLASAPDTPPTKAADAVGHAVVGSNGGGIDASFSSPNKTPSAANMTTMPTMARASPSTKMLQDHVKDETLLKVKIKSAHGEPGKFYVPVSLLVDRELEMRKSAKDFGIRHTRWSKSRLFREWKTQLEEDVRNNETTPRTEILIVLDPEQDCASSNQSQTFRWQSWLTTCIRAYYNTGTIRIPDDCLGSDILLALEYFGILYSPDQLVFDSFGGYLRVKLWSDYFTHRAKMADWVVQKLVTTPSRHSHCYVTSAEPDEKLYFLNSNKTMEVLDGQLKLDADRYGTTPSRAVVHEFFNDEEQDGQDGTTSPSSSSQQQQHERDKMDELMRQDFCAFVQASLPGTNVSFALKQVTTSNKETVERAVLRIYLVPKPSPEQPRAMHKQLAVSNPMEHQIQKGTAASTAPTCTSPETHPTQPITVSTQSELSTIERAYEIVRSKTESSIPRRVVTLETSFEDRPDDEFTPNSSPERTSKQQQLQQQQHSTPLSPNNRSSWRKDELLSVDQPRETIRHEDPSIDLPREPLQGPADFVRSLSERIIRQTIADMDKKNDGLPPLRQQSPGTRPFDEGVEPHLTEDDIMQLKLPSLPSMEFDKDYSRRPSELPFQAHPQKYDTRVNTPSPHLEVIGTTSPTKTRGSSAAVASATAASADKPAPVEHVDVDNVKPCDGSVMSALSNPFDDPAQQANSLDMLDAHRPHAAVEVLSGFRTPVDALSLADDRSVRIEGQEEEVDEEAVEEVEEEEEEEEVVVPKRTKPKRTRKKEMRRVVYTDDESEAGCVSNFLNVVCSPFIGEDVIRETRRDSVRKRRHRKYSDDDTPNTQSETDEDDDPTISGNERAHKASSRRRHRHRNQSDSNKMSSGEVIAEIGGIADTLVEEMASSLGSMFRSDQHRSSNAKRRSRPKQRSRRHFSCSEMEDEELTEPPQPDYDVEVDETVGETTVDQPTADEVITKIVPLPRENVVRKASDRPPLPVSKSTRSTPGASSASKSPRSETSMDRIQEILRTNAVGSSPYSSKRRSANVMRNLELLQSPPNSSSVASNTTSTEDYINRVTVVESKATSAGNRSPLKQRPSTAYEKSRRDGKKGLLGFLRKK